RRSGGAGQRGEGCPEPGAGHGGRHGETRPGPSHAMYISHTQTSISYQHSRINTHTHTHTNTHFYTTHSCAHVHAHTHTHDFPLLGCVADSGPSVSLGQSH